MANIISEQKTIADVFDLSRFSKEGFKDLFERVTAAEKYLWENCNKLDTQYMKQAINPIKLWCRHLEKPSMNSHGELEIWVTDAHAELFDWKKHYAIPLRSMDDIPKGAVLCIDTKHILDLHTVRYHSVLFLTSITVYGNVRSAREEKRYIPGDQTHFIEIGALSYSDVGNSWTSGVYGKGFRGTARSEQ